MLGLFSSLESITNIPPKEILIFYPKNRCRSIYMYMSAQGVMTEKNMYPMRSERSML